MADPDRPQESTSYVGTGVAAFATGVPTATPGAPTPIPPATQTVSVTPTSHSTVTATATAKASHAAAIVGASVGGSLMLLLFSILALFLCLRIRRPPPPAQPPPVPPVIHVQDRASLYTPPNSGKQLMPDTPFSPLGPPTPTEAMQIPPMRPLPTSPLPLALPPISEARTHPTAAISTKSEAAGYGHRSSLRMHDHPYARRVPVPPNLITIHDGGVGGGGGGG